MAQLGALAENIKKRKEAQEAAEGKTPPPQVTPAVKGAVEGLNKTTEAAPPPKPYIPIKTKTEEEKAKLREQMAAELAVRKRNRGEK